MEQISSRLCYRDGGNGADPGTGAGGSGIPPPKKAERAGGSGTGIEVIWKVSFKKTMLVLSSHPILLLFFYANKQIDHFCGAKANQAGPPPPLLLAPWDFSRLGCYLRGLHKIKLRGFLILETHSISLVNGNLKLSEAGWEMFKTKKQDSPGLF